MALTYDTRPPLDDVVILLERFITESIQSTHTAVASVRGVLISPDFLCIMVRDGVAPVGIFIGGVTRHPLFTDRIASDLVNYVIPEYRGGFIATRLVRKFEAWARRKQVKYVNLGQSTAIGDMARVSKFYNKLGFQTTGFNTIKEL